VLDATVAAYRLHKSAQLSFWTEFSARVTQPISVVRLLTVHQNKFLKNVDLVRMVGLEPTRLSALEPKSSAATNYATSASMIITYRLS
jgi:hypothetical protein